MRKWSKLLLTLGVVVFLVLYFLEQFVVIQYYALPTIMHKKLNNRKVVDLKAAFAKEMKNEPRGSTRAFCGCSDSNVPSNFAKSSNSTCSWEAIDAGNGQKVISYSLFVKSLQDKEFFFDGIPENMRKIQEFFPGWIVYIFTNIPKTALSCDLICRYRNLFWCDIRKIPQLGDLSNVNGHVWRFLPIFDQNVDIFMSRDLDSLPSEREQSIVNEWIRSTSTFHVIRDSQWHDTEILAGLWGAKTYLLSPRVKANLQTKFVREGLGDSTKTLDQELLQRYVFTHYKSITLAHDSYYCGKYGESETRPFPTQRNGEEFVGLDKFKQSYRLFVGRLKSCPSKCRPIHGKHWTYC